MSFDLFFPERFPPFLSSGPTEGFTKAMIVFPFPAQVQGCAWKSTAVNPPKSGELKDTMSTSLWVTEVPPSPQPCCCRTVVPSWGSFACQGTLDNAWRHFWMSQLGSGCYWHMVGPRMLVNGLQSQDSPLPTKNDLVREVTSAGVDKSLLLTLFVCLYVLSCFFFLTFIFINTNDILLNQF